MSPPRDRYVYYPNTLEVPEAVAVNVRGRSFKIAAEVDIHTPEAAGVLFAHGHHFGGHALYIKDGKLKYVYDYLGEGEQAIISDVDVPTGKCVLGVEFTKQSQTPQATVGIAHALHRRREGRRAQATSRPRTASSTSAAKD